MYYRNIMSVLLLYTIHAYCRLSRGSLTQWLTMRRRSGPCSVSTLVPSWNNNLQTLGTRFPFSRCSTITSAITVSRQLYPSDTELRKICCTP